MNITLGRPAALAAWAVGLVLVWAMPASAQLDAATGTADATNKEGAASQTRVDKIDDETENLAADYRGQLDLAEGLRRYNEQQERLIARQLEEIDLLKRQIDGVATLERDITPLMGQMLDALEKFVELDTPFLLEERKDRVARLRTLMDDPVASAAEKFRRVLEAYQIENDYGRTIEAYEASLDGTDQSKKVEFLKIGRVGFYYQTRDQSETGMWDPETREWQILGGGYTEPVRTGIRMARETLPPNLLLLPVPGPEQASE